MVFSSRYNLMGVFCFYLVNNWMLSAISQHKLTIERHYQKQNTFYISMLTSIRKIKRNAEK